MQCAVVLSRGEVEGEVDGEVGGRAVCAVAEVEAFGGVGGEVGGGFYGVVVVASAFELDADDGPPAAVCGIEHPRAVVVARFEGVSGDEGEGAEFVL
ncbi:MAG: hypothetical protein RR137_09520 [Odoribacter sp.]